MVTDEALRVSKVRRKIFTRPSLRTRELPLPDAAATRGTEGGRNDEATLEVRWEMSMITRGWDMGVESLEIGGKPLLFPLGAVAGVLSMPMWTM